MYYEVNISLNGKHLFATAPRSITTSWELEKVVDIIKDKFPAEEGYEIKISHTETTSHVLSLEQYNALLNK